MANDRPDLSSTPEDGVVDPILSEAVRLVGSEPVFQHPRKGFLHDLQARARPESTRQRTAVARSLLGSSDMIWVDVVFVVVVATAAAAAAGFRSILL